MSFSTEVITILFPFGDKENVQSESTPWHFGLLAIISSSLESNQLTNPSELCDKGHWRKENKKLLQLEVLLE